MTCNADIRPAAIGIPLILENCGTLFLTYNDLETKGGCALGVDRWIRRTWTTNRPIGQQINLFSINNNTVCCASLMLRCRWITMVISLGWNICAGL